MSMDTNQEQQWNKECSMKNYVSLMVVLLVLFAGVVPCMSNAEQSHEEWVEIQSVSWSQHQPGAATRLADGKYRTTQGQFLIVANGKVVAKGADYRTYRPGNPPVPAATTPRDVAAGNQQERTGLLLPAVQHAQAQDNAPAAAAGSRGFQAAPQAGIEPDEIDAAARATDRRRAGMPARAPGAGRASVQQMMFKLGPRQAMLLPAQPRGSMSQPTNVQAKPSEPPKYEIADCGTASSPMICCHHEAGDGSSCNLFKILCENAGGTAQGDGESAACSDW
jgi:hypothetical protein